MPYIRDLLDQGYSGRAIRYLLLSHNYTKPLNFSREALDQANAAVRRLHQCIAMLNAVEDAPPYGELNQLLYDIKSGFTEAMDDDLNISSALASVFRAVRNVNRLVSNKQIDATGATRVKDAFKRIDEVLKIFDFEESVIDGDVEGLIRQRQDARHRKDWALADQIRERLKAMGVEVKDKKPE
jgi:cysteinyl-tRNA synthetase